MEKIVCKRNVKVDELGRILISSQLSDILGLAYPDKLRIYANDDSIILEKIDTKDFIMKSVDIVRSIDEINRVVLPIEFRCKFGIEEGNELEEKVKENKIVLTKI